MKQLTPQEAHDFLARNADARLIDVRSETEYLFVGHPLGAEHIAWQDGPDWELQPDFVEEVRRFAGDTSRPLLLICRCGNRSQRAAEALTAAGFGAIYNVTHGFEGERNEDGHRSTLNGWRHDGLPWAQG